MPCWPSSTTSDPARRRPAARTAAWLALVAAAALVAACGRPADAPAEAREGSARASDEVSPSARATRPASFPASFTVRGRWADPAHLRYRIDVAGSPVDATVFRTAVRRAAERWSELDGITLAEAANGERADVAFGWRIGAHERCTPFGFDTSVAHTGPVRSPTYVHFDAERRWSLEGDEGTLSLVDNALHEVGHVLGLHHSADPKTLMYADPLRTRADLTAGELAGIASLYGGGSDSPGDLEILDASRLDRPEGTSAPPLRGAAPAATTDFDVFDVDGDGVDEVVVWRTDAAGNGALIAYHFDAGRRLMRTTGPLFGSIGVGTRVRFRVGEDGLRFLVQLLPEDRVALRAFDEDGRLHPLPDYAFALEDLVDADGDGVLDEPPRIDADDRERVGDLDGDGSPELVRRRDRR